jgi:ABC-type multidrug transport system fused ATPase/permease subunit
MNVNKLIGNFLRKNQGFLLSYILFMLAYPLTSVLLPKYYGQLFDDLKEGRKLKYKQPLVLLLVTNAMYTILDKIDSVFLPKLQAYVRTHIVRVVLENYKDKFQEQETGILISKIIKLPIVIRDLARQVRNYIVPIVLIVIAAVGRFMVIDRRLGAFAIVGVLILLAVLIPYGRRCIRIAANVDHEADTIHEDIAELFDNLMDIYSMGTYDKEMAGLDRNQDEVIKRYQRSYDSTNNLRCAMNALGIVVFVSLSVYGYHLYKMDQIDLTDMLNVVLTSKYIIGKMGSFAGELPDMLFNLGTYMRSQEFLGQIAKNGEGQATETFQFPKGQIVFKDVGIVYGDKNVVQDFNLSIQPGECIALTGKIGAGKSSLVKGLLKLIPYTGNIYVDGKDISTMDPSSVRSQVLYVRQNPLPFNRTLYENIVYGNETVTKRQVADLFDKYDLHSFFRHDLDALVGKKGGRLSGGQKMVMFLLRIIIQRKKKVVVIDEPTSSLDPVTASKIIEIIRDVTRKQTTIIITHDKRVSDIADRVLVVGAKAE